MSSNGAPLVVERSTHEGPTTNGNTENDADVVRGMEEERQWVEGEGRWTADGRMRRESEEEGRRRRVRWDVREWMWRESEIEGRAKRKKTFGVRRGGFQLNFDPFLEGQATPHFLLCCSASPMWIRR